MKKKNMDKKTIVLWILSLGVLVQSVVALGFVDRIAKKEREQKEDQEQLSEEVKEMIEEELR